MFSVIFEIKFLIYCAICVLATIGVYAFLWWFFKCTLPVIQYVVASIKPYFKCQSPQSLFEQYGSWAVCTGSTDGLGKYFALELSRQGFNIFLLARTESKLKETSKEIVDCSNVSVKYRVFDFSIADQKQYEILQQELSQLDVGILINNVGKMYEHPDELDNVSEHVLWDIINVNIAATTMMTKLIIPQMKAKRRGLIVNISSGTECQPMPLTAVYSASKAYIRNFSLAMQKELADYKIDVNLLTPFFVQTKMIEFSKRFAKGNFYTPTPEAYAKSAIKRFGKCTHSSGYWLHRVQFSIIHAIPEFARIMIAFKMNKSFRNDFIEQQMKPIEV